MGQTVEDIFNREKDGLFHCKTCIKQYFTKTVFENHLKHEHFSNIKKEKDNEAKKELIVYQDSNTFPHISTDEILTTSDSMIATSKNIKERKLSNQTLAAGVKLEVTAEISKERPSKNLKETNLK